IWARPPRVERGLNVALDLGLERRPFGVGHERRNEMRAELGQRVALRVEGDLLVRAVAALVVRAGMAAQPRHRQTYERRSVAGAYMIHAFGEQRGRFARV